MLVIPDEVMQAAGMSAEELRQEVAILLFERERLTLEQASHLSGVDRISFQRLLASRGVSIHYGVAEFEKDLETLRRLNRI